MCRTKNATSWVRDPSSTGSASISNVWTGRTIAFYFHFDQLAVGCQGGATWAEHIGPNTLPPRVTQSQWLSSSSHVVEDTVTQTSLNHKYPKHGRFEGLSWGSGGIVGIFRSRRWPEKKSSWGNIICWPFVSWTRSPLSAFGIASFWTQAKDNYRYLNPKKGDSFFSFGQEALRNMSLSPFQSLCTPTLLVAFPLPERNPYSLDCTLFVTVTRNGHTQGHCRRTT